MIDIVLGALLLFVAAMGLAWKAGNRIGVELRGLRAERTRIVDEVQRAIQAETKSADDAKIRSMRRRALRQRGPYSAARPDPRGHS